MSNADSIELSPSEKKKLGRPSNQELFEKHGPAALKKWKHFTEKEKKFVISYCENGMNRKRAWDDAGYSERISGKHKWDNAAEVLRRPHINYEIKKRLKLFNMKEEEMMARHSSSARGDIGDMLESKAIVCPKCGYQMESERLRFSLEKAVENGVTHLIKKIREQPGGKIEIELYDADRARKDLMKVSGLFADKQADATNGLAAVIAAAMAHGKDDDKGIETDYEVVDE